MTRFSSCRDCGTAVESVDTGRPRYYCPDCRAGRERLWQQQSRDRRRVHRRYDWLSDLVPEPAGEGSSWWDHAACLGLDPDLFYPERGEPTRETKAICAVCPVRAECLDYALDNREKFGIWGGTSERQRRRLRAVREVPGGGVTRVQCCSELFCRETVHALGLCKRHYELQVRRRNPYRPGSGHHSGLRGHGTPSHYNSYGCRCRLCREAWRRYRAGEWDGSRVTEPDVVRCLCGCGQEWPRHDPDTPAKVVDHLAAGR